MESVLIHDKLEPDRLLEVFANATRKVDYKNKHSGQNSEVVIITGSKFFLRYRQYIGFTLISYFDGENTKVDYGVVGFGSGTSFFNYNAAGATDVVNEISRGLGELVESSGNTQQRGRMDH